MLIAIRLIKISAAMALLVSVSVNFSGCGSAQNLPSSSAITGGTCPTGIGGMNADCCDSTGALLSPPPASDSSCTVAVPGVPGVTNPMTAGAAAAGSSLGENANASKLANGSNAMGTSGEVSAATAAPNSPAVAALPIPPAPLTALGMTSGTATDGSGSGSGSGIGSGSSVATAPVPISPDTSSSPNPDLSGANVAAYSAGGGGLLPNGAVETGFHYGNGTVGGLGASAGGAEVGFGAQRSLASSGSEDPGDYFTRIGLQDSLFKKVEKRYRATSANWAMAAVSKPLTITKQK